MLKTDWWNDDYEKSGLREYSEIYGIQEINLLPEYAPYSLFMTEVQAELVITSEIRICGK